MAKPNTALSSSVTCTPAQKFTSYRSPCTGRSVWQPSSPGVRAAGSSSQGDVPTATPPPPPRPVLDSRQRQKLDGGDDRQFYSAPRLVHHLDANFRRQLTELYRQLIPEGAAVLDLCSSWVSHLPPESSYSRVVGHGMNAAELAKNPQLTEFIVRDLNRQPAAWAFGDASFDAVLCVAGVQYLEQPEAVFAEIRRILKPGGVVIIAFSNRMFYHKAIAAWRDSTDYGRCLLVKSYIAAAGGFGDPQVVKQVELPAAGAAGGPLQQVQLWAQRLLSDGRTDPFYAVVAHRLQAD